MSNPIAMILDEYQFEDRTKREPVVVYVDVRNVEDRLDEIFAAKRLLAQDPRGMFAVKWGGPPKTLKDIVDGMVRYIHKYGVRSPFQIVDFYDYYIIPATMPRSKSLNPCGEISLGKPEFCQLGVRCVASPFNLESFTELIVIEPIGFCKPFFIRGWEWNHRKA